MSDRRRSPDSTRHSRRRPSESRSRSRHHRSRSSESRHGRSRSPESRSRRSRSSRSPESKSRRRHDDSRERRHRHRSVSSSPDSRRRRRHRHSEKHKRRRSRSSSSSGSDSEDDHRRKRKDKKRKDKKKKDKKKKKKSKLSSVGDQWGKYGIIHEADIFTKEPEFQAWLIEVKGENIEILNNNKRKEMFVDFMEDYNTATMPHEKFYNLAKYEKRQQSIRMGDPMPVTSSDNFDFHNDEERLRTQHRQAARLAASRQPTLTLSEEQIKELTRVNRERIEADRMRKMGLKPKESMGVRYEEE